MSEEDFLKNLICGRWHRFNLTFDMIEKIKKLSGRWNKTPIAYYKGNYAFFVDGECTYIGQTESLYGRLNDHFRYFLMFASKDPKYHFAIRLENRPKRRFHKSYKTRRLWVGSSTERGAIEIRLILRLKPRANSLTNFKNYLVNEIFNPTESKRGACLDE